jgi:HK97 family phage major capsid protein
VVQLKEKLKNKLAVMKAMVDKAKAENRGFTADEETIYTAHEAELATIKAAVADEEKFLARQATIEAEMGASAGSIANKGHVPALEVIKDEADRPWKSFGEQLLAVRTAAAPGGKMDARLTVRNAATGLNESVGSDGGFLVQQDYSTKLLERAYKTGVLAPLAEKIPLSTAANGLKINGIDETSRVNGSRWGGIQSYWENEADTPAASKPKFRKIELNLKKLFGICYATDEMLADASALAAIVERGFASEFGFKIDDGIFRGTGSGQLLGIMNSPALVSVAKKTGQAANTIITENIVNMVSRLWSGSMQNAVWYINQNTLPQLYTMSLAVGTGGAPIYMPPGGISGSPYSTLFGRPVMPIEQCETLGTVGDIVLADISQYIMIDKGDVKSDVSVHVRFLYDEQVFKFTYRVDGQPAWHSALTPYKGTSTLSPFVALATRA